ncbi:MAG TPA: DUF721 domain-containing protein [Acidimicrobiia bacterium]|jgi:hypothetical protein
MTGPEPLEDVLKSLLARLDLPAPSVMVTLREEWDEVAGPQWAGRSRPVYVRGQELVVEAQNAALVSVLRYGIGELCERLDQRLGKGVVESVRVVAKAIR